MEVEGSSGEDQRFPALSVSLGALASYRFRFTPNAIRQLAENHCVHGWGGATNAGFGEASINSIARAAHDDVLTPYGAGPTTTTIPVRATGTSIANSQIGFILRKFWILAAMQHGREADARGCKGLDRVIFGRLLRRGDVMQREE